MFINRVTNARHCPFGLGYALTALYADITGHRFASCVYLPHPALQESCLPGLAGGMKYPVEIVPDIAVELGAYQAFFRGEHIMVPGITGAGGIEKTHGAFSLCLHGFKYIMDFVGLQVAGPELVFSHKSNTLHFYP
jgi:hypothetical protein